MDLTSLNDALPEQDDVLTREQVNVIRRRTCDNERPLEADDVYEVPADSQIGRILASNKIIIREADAEMRDCRAKVLRLREMKGIRSNTKKQH